MLQNSGSERLTASPVPVVFSSDLQTVVFALALSSRPTPAKRAQFEVAKPLPTDNLLGPDVTKIVTLASNGARTHRALTSISLFICCS